MSLLAHLGAIASTNYNPWAKAGDVAIAESVSATALVTHDGTVAVTVSETVAFDTVGRPEMLSSAATLSSTESVAVVIRKDALSSEIALSHSTATDSTGVHGGPVFVESATDVALTSTSDRSVALSVGVVETLTLERQHTGYTSVSITVSSVLVAGLAPILLETGDSLLLESGDVLLNEEQ